MEDVIQYLTMKNKYYEKFYSLSRHFLEQTHKNKWDNLSFFVENRERLLNLIRSLDIKIARAFKECTLNEIEIDSYRNTLKKLFDKKKILGDQIIGVDLQLISKIDAFKTETIKDLKSNLKTSSHLDSFERTSQTKRTRTKDA